MQIKNITLKKNESLTLEKIAKRYFIRRYFREENILPYIHEIEVGISVNNIIFKSRVSLNEPKYLKHIVNAMLVDLVNFLNNPNN